MKQYSVIFFIKQSLNGLFMNSIMSITSVFILTSCLILTGCSALLILNTNLNLEQLATLNKIVFYIDENYESEENIEEIKEKIISLDNVATIKYISREEGIEKFRAQYENFAAIFEDKDFLDKLIADKAIPISIEIEYEDISGVSTLDYQLKCIEGMAKVKNQVQIAEIIKNLKSIIMLVLIGFLIIMFVVAIFIILNTVKLSVHARKEEIEIMRYIGATNFFIVVPFLIEGIIIGAVSGIIAYIAQLYIYNGALAAIIKMGAGLEFVKFSDVNIILFLGFVFTGVFCGLFGSGMSARKYVKV